MKIRGLLIIGFGSYGYGKLIKKARFICAQMLLNVLTFVTPDPTLLAILALAKTLDDLFNKRGSSVEEKKAAKKALVEALQELASYVEVVAQGDPGILDQSGFDKRKAPVRNESQLPPPSGFKTLISLVQSTIRLHCKPVPYTQHYEVTYYPTLAGGPSVTVTFDKCDEMLIENLTHALDYTFVIRAKGAIGYGGYSQKITILVD